MLSRHAHAFVEDLLGVFDALEQEQVVETLYTEREGVILDVSFYDYPHSRQIRIRQVKDSDAFRFIYDIPVAESSRPKHIRHVIEFSPSTASSGTMTIRSEPGKEPVIYDRTPCMIVCERYGLPWDPKTMHE